MRAAVFHAPGQALSIEDRQMPVSRPGDIAMKVAYSGFAVPTCTRPSQVRRRWKAAPYWAMNFPVS